VVWAEEHRGVHNTILARLTLAVLLRYWFCWPWIRVAACSWMACTTFGWQWPVDSVPMPVPRTPCGEKLESRKQSLSNIQRTLNGQWGGTREIEIRLMAGKGGKRES
jgi:hypothetical protein